MPKKWIQLYVEGSENSGYVTPEAMKLIDNYLGEVTSAWFPILEELPVQEKDCTWEVCILDAKDLSHVKAILKRHYGLEIISENEMAEIELSEWAIKNDISGKAVILLGKTIDKEWRLILNGEGADRGFRSCYLCGEFYVNGCDYCPFLRKTRKRNCKGTPYENWDSHHSEKHPKKGAEQFHRKVECPECVEIARDMIGFAKDLYEDCIKGDKKGGDNGRNQ